MPAGKATKKSQPKKAVATPATQAVKRKVLPKNVKKLVTHRSTKHLWAKVKRTAKKKGVAPESLLKKKPKFVVKKIAGEKNGGKRKVLVKKGKKYYPTEDTPLRRRVGHITYKMHKRTLKSGKKICSKVTLIIS